MDQRAHHGDETHDSPLWTLSHRAEQDHTARRHPNDRGWPFTL